VGPGVVGPAVGALVSASVGASVCAVTPCKTATAQACAHGEASRWMYGSVRVVCVCVCVSAHTTSAIAQKLCTNHQAVLARGVALETEANHVQQQQRCHERTRGAALLRSLGAKRPRHRPWWRNAEGTDKRGEEPHPCAPFAPCHSSHCPCTAKHAVDECPGACCVVAKAHAGTCMHDVAKAVQGIRGGREEETKVFLSLTQSPPHEQSGLSHTHTHTRRTHTHTPRLTPP